jgi:hypothetical protein
MNVLLPAEVGFGTPHRLGQRRCVDSEGSLTGAMLVSRVVAYGLDEAHIE